MHKKPRKHSVKTPSNMVFFAHKKCLTRNPKCTHGKANQVKDLDTYGFIEKNPYVAWLYVGMSKCLFSTDRVFKLGFSLVFGADFNRKRLLVIFLLTHRNSKRFRSLWITQRRLLNCLRRKKRRVTGQNVISCSSRRMLVSVRKKHAYSSWPAGGLDLQNEWQSANRIHAEQFRRGYQSALALTHG